MPEPRKVTLAQVRRWVEAITGEKIAPSTMYRPGRRNPWREALVKVIEHRPELLAEIKASSPAA